MGLIHTIYRGRWRMWRLLLIPLLIACGDSDSPTKSQHELVGTWAYETHNANEVFIAGTIAWMEDEGATQAEINAARIVMEANVENSSNPLESSFTRIRFESDGTWTDSSGDAGGWSTAGGDLTVTEPGEDAFTVGYFVTGDELILITKWELFFQGAIEDGDSEYLVILGQISRFVDAPKVIFRKAN
jgi:hypothetical protein